MTFFGYGCVSTRHTKAHTREAIEQTNIYKVLKRIFHNNNWDITNIAIDILNANNKNRYLLSELISKLSNNTSSILLITSIDVLGKTRNEVIEIYKIILDNKINMIVYDTMSDDCVGKYSTCDFSGAKFSDKILLDYLNQLQSQNIKTARGNISHEFEPELFRKTYWEYENYFIKESTALEALSISKTLFYKWCQMYEQDEIDCLFYEIEELEQEKLYNISSKPKRHGKQPDKMNELIIEYSNTNDLSSACKKIGIPNMTKITYQRYVRKTSRQVMSKALQEYCKEL